LYPFKGLNFVGGRLDPFGVGNGVGGILDPFGRGHGVRLGLDPFSGLVSERPFMAPEGCTR
jgi:hypothetical protein